MKSGAILLSIAVLAVVAFTVEEDGSLAQIAKTDDAGTAAVPSALQPAGSAWEEDAGWTDSDPDPDPGQSRPDILEPGSETWSDSAGIEEYAVPTPTGRFVNPSNITPPPRPTGELSNPMQPGNDNVPFDPILR